MPTCPGSLLLAVMVCPPVAADRQAPNAPAEDPQRLARAVVLTTDALGRDGSAGVCLASLGDRVVRTATWGEDRSRSIKARTRIAIGPLTRQFTIVALLRLAQRDALALGDSLAEHLAVDGRGGDAAREILVRHVVEGASGLPSTLALDAVDTAACERYVSRALETPPAAAPGHLHYPSATDTALVAALVESVTDLEFETAVTRDVFAAAGLEDTCFATTRANWNEKGSTGAESTPADLHRWFRALQGDRLLDDDRRHELFVHDVDGSAIAARVELDDAREPTARIVEASTASHSFLCVHDLATDAMLLFVSTPDADLDRFRRVVETAWRRDDPALLEALSLVGRYAIGKDEALDVVFEDGGLVLRSLGQDTSARLQHGRPTFPEWPNLYDEIAARARVRIRPLLELDRASLARSFHGDAATEAADRARRTIESLVAAHGRAGRAWLIGTRIQGTTDSWFRVRFGDRPTTLHATWFGEKLRDVCVADAPPPFRVPLTRSGRGTYDGQSLDGKASLRVRFTAKGRRLELRDASTKKRPVVARRR